MPIIYAYLMEEIRELKLERFKEDSTLERLKVFMDDTEDAKDWGDARGLLSIFDIKFPELLDPTKIGYEFARDYRALWARCVFMGFPAVKNEQLETLYREHILEVFEHYDDPRTVIDQQLALVSYSDAFASRLVVIATSLQANTQKIGANPIIRASGKSVPQEVDWWLTEYRSFIGPSVKRGAVEQASFLTKNKNVQRLSGEERKTLTKTIQFIDYLFYPTFKSNLDIPAVMMLEERARQRAMLLGGPETQPDGAPAPQQRENLELRIKNQETVAIGQKSEIVRSTPFVQSKPASVAASPVIRNTPPTTPAPVPKPQPAPMVAPPSREEQWYAFFTKRPQEIQSVLASLLTGGSVEVSDGVPFVRAVVRMGKTDMLVIGALNAQTLKTTLRALYAKAGLSENESAREGAHIGSLLKKAGKEEFFHMAYFDMATQEFKWN